jgi:hypothetical protein
LTKVLSRSLTPTHSIYTPETTERRQNLSSGAIELNRVPRRSGGRQVAIACVDYQLE